MEIFAAQLINGIATGAIYALLVTSYNLLYLIRGIIQFALAHIMVMSMYIIWIVMELTGGNVLMGLALGVPAGIGAGVGMSIATEPILRPMAVRGIYMESLIVTVGLAIILTNVMSKFINEGVAITFSKALTGEGIAVRVGMVSFSRADILTLAASILIVLGLFYLLYRVQFGRAFRAIAQSLRKARLIGIPINRMAISSFAIAGLVAGASGVLLAMTLGYASPGLPNSLAIKGLVLLLVAGSGNLIGGLITAFGLGIAESMTITYLPGQWSDAIIFGIILTIIMIRPGGLFGAKV
jgi:branched-chain amino acid transport system permease protein